MSLFRISDVITISGLPIRISSGLTIFFICSSPDVFRMIYGSLLDLSCLGSLTSLIVEIIWIFFYFRKIFRNNYYLCHVPTFIFHISRKNERNLDAPDLVFVSADTYESAIQKLTDLLSERYDQLSLPRYFLVSPLQIQSI